MIEFQKTYQAEKSLAYITDCLGQGNLAGDGKYTELCRSWMKDAFGSVDVLMTTSCTHALELALQLLQLNSEDEVIIPSFTYPSTANAVLLAGGKVVFSQVTPKDLTLDPHQLEAKITPHTKAILVVHYGGNVCQMEEIMQIASKHGLYVIEDAAQSFLSEYKHRYSGTFGDFGCFSFHGTKDVVAGEGGALLVNNAAFKEAAAIFRDKGTNREAFNRGEVDYYEWVAKGSSYGPSDLLMALLYGQLELSASLLKLRRRLYQQYAVHFLEEKYSILAGFSTASEHVQVNGHLFYLIFNQVKQARAFKKYMTDHGVQVHSHFVPLHSSRYGQTIHEGTDEFLVEEDLGQRLLRLPIYPDLTRSDAELILNLTKAFMMEAADDIYCHSNL